MRQTILSTAAVILLGAGCILAQPPGMPGMRNRDGKTWAERKTQFIADRLGLTDTQKQQVLTLSTTSDQNSESLETKLGQARRSLREATRRNAPYTEIDQLAANIGFLVGQVEAIQAKTDTAIYNLLTAEQRQKMDRGYRGGRGGPEGQGGPPHFQQGREQKQQ